MKRNRLVAAGISTAALGVALALPALATAASAEGSFECTYTLDRATYTISGECTGQTPAGAAGGSFTGTVDPATRSGTGSVTMTSPLGSGEGTFSGTFDTSGGTAEGTFGINGPGGGQALPFTAVQR